MSKRQNDMAVKHDLFGSYRLFLAIFTLFGFVILYSLRVGLSIAIVSMVNHTALDTVSNFDDSTNNMSFNESNKTENSDTSQKILQENGGQFVWDKEIQGHVLGAFFYGSFISQIPSGLLAEKYGSKPVMGVLCGISAIATILTPLAAKLDYVFLIIIRIIAGIGAGGTYPVIISFWSRWAPEDERSKLTNISLSGCHLGVLLTLSLGGFLCSYVGWESMFYIAGGSLSIWVLLWCYFVSDCPAEAKFISKDEKMYVILHTQNDQTKIRPKCPWSSLLTSPQVWGLMIVCFCSDWGFFTILTNIPSFFFDVMKLKLTTNGILSALPFLGSFLTMHSVPHIADFFISKKLLTIRSVRILMSVVSCFGVISFLICVTLVYTSDHLLAVFFLTLLFFFGTVKNSGFQINALDIAPDFAGTIMGLCNGFAALSGFLAPYIAATLTKHKTFQEWRVVFYLTAGIHVFGTIIFVITCRGEVLPWARVIKKQNEQSGCELVSLNTNI